MAIDIGQILFAEILRMSEYPGSPFTGNIVNDLIMFLLVPSVFIIIIVYVLTGRMFRNHKIRLLLGITLYLFIIAGGYYQMFARLAGPYFLILLVFVGVLYFFAEHFGFKRDDGSGGGGGRQGFNTREAAISSSHAQATATLLNSIEIQCGVVRSTKEGPDQRLLPEALKELGRLVVEFRNLKAGMKFNAGERARYSTLLAVHKTDENRILKEAEAILKSKIIK